MIETKRLLLRPHRLSDFPHYAALWAGAPEGADKPVRQSPLGDLGEEEAWARLLRFIGHWQVFGYGPFLVLDRDGDSIVAEAGLAWFHRGIARDFDDAPEAMWKVDDRHQGRGIATEAMQSSLRWFDAQRAEVRTVCMIHDTNAPSIHVAERLGFRPFGCAAHRGSAVLLFERIRAAVGRASA
jgi:RimJ/RimL family protein N-acetyltransferase